MGMDVDVRERIRIVLPWRNPIVFPTHNRFAGIVVERVAVRLRSTTLPCIGCAWTRMLIVDNRNDLLDEQRFLASEEL
jgi:hypothetical protein